MRRPRRSLGRTEIRRAGRPARRRPDLAIRPVRDRHRRASMRRGSKDSRVVSDLPACPSSSPHDAGHAGVEGSQGWEPSTRPQARPAGERLIAQYIWVTLMTCRRASVVMSHTRVRARVGRRTGTYAGNAAGQIRDARFRSARDQRGGWGRPRRRPTARRVREPPERGQSGRAGRDRPGRAGRRNDGPRASLTRRTAAHTHASREARAGCPGSRSEHSPRPPTARQARRRRSQAPSRRLPQACTHRHREPARSRHAAAAARRRCAAAASPTTSCCGHCEARAQGALHVRLLGVIACGRGTRVPTPRPAPAA
jgi:hypothetical protein